MRLLILFTFFSLSTSAQSFLLFNDSSVVKEIELPSAQPFDTAHPYRKVKNPLVYVCSNNDLYDLFGYNYFLKYRDFDFNNYHILGQEVCRQCHIVCKHDEGDKNCHRNRCNLVWKWVMRRNNIAFSEIPVSALPQDSESAIQKIGRLNWRDTVIQDKENPASGKWYTTGGGDCHARFSYKIYTDNFHSALLLREWNYYGGCRAGGFKEFTLSFKLPDGIKQFTKSTTHVD